MNWNMKLWPWRPLLGYFLLGLSFGLVISLRIRSALFRLPPDPGYYMFDDARHASFWKVFSYNSWEGYISILPRLIAIATGLFPLAYTAILASLITTLIWTFTAIVLFRALQLFTKSTSLALLGSAMVVFVPSASESSLGNFGNAKWQLFILTTVISAFPTLFLRFKWTSVVIFLISGLSNPLAIVATIPLFTSLKHKGSEATRFSRILFACSTITFFIQLMAFRASGAGTVRSQIVHWKWGKFPIFWNYNFLIPILLSIVVMGVVLLSFFLGHKIMWQPLNMAATSLAIITISYVQGGLADRYFVAPTVLSWLSLIVLFHESEKLIRALTRALVIVGSAVFLIGSVVWFRANSYLNSGPTWISEINRVRIECIETKIELVSVNLSVGSTQIRCRDIGY
jgi:hypothetical protein